MTRLEASSNQALATTPMPLALLPSRASANPCTLCPYHRHLSRAECCSQSGPCRQQLLQPCFSQGLGSVWAPSNGWSRQVGSIQTPGQWQQDSALLNPNQRAQKLKEQIQLVGKGSTAWLGLHPALLSCWTLRNQGT